MSNGLEQNQIISEQSKVILSLQEDMVLQNTSLVQQVHTVTELRGTVSEQNQIISEQSSIISWMQEALALQNMSIVALQSQILLLATNMTRTNAILAQEILTVAQIVGGVSHSCALISVTGGVRCWGHNQFGQLGDGTTTDLHSPPSNDVLTGVAQIAAGWHHTCALMSGTGGVRCWGSNDNGQLGDGTTNDRYSPPSSDVLSGAVQIAAGGYHTCALIVGTGDVQCWGSNYYGQLGDGTTNDLHSPPGSKVLSGAVQIAVGGYHTCALMSVTGGVRCWGFNQWGQLGDGTWTNLFSPPSNDMLTQVAQIAAGGYHTCARMSGTGGVRCWGYNGDGELGDGSTINLSTPPSTDVLTGVAQIAAGVYHTCARMSAAGGLDGVQCWGQNGYGQLGDGETTNLSSPSGDVLMGVGQIAVGKYFTCALMSVTSGVRCWGYNIYGQLGDGTTTDLSSPPSCNLNFPIST